MSKKRSNANKTFMVFNAVLFIAVVAICFIFLYLAYAMKRDAEKKETYEGKYLIEFSGDFVNESLSIYVNDSLLLNRTMPDTIVRLNINRFAEEHVLMIVDNQTDNTTPFNLNKEGSRVNVRKEKGEIVFEETSKAF